MKIELNRTELYRLANALWWARIGELPDCSKPSNETKHQWWTLEDYIRYYARLSCGHKRKPNGSGKGTDVSRETDASD